MTPSSWTRTADASLRRRLRIAGFVLVFAVTLWSLPANAQTPSPLPEWEYSAGVLLGNYFEPSPPKWQGELGMGLAAQPVYDGSSSYEVLPAPSFDIRYYNLAFLSVGEGLGINVLHGKNYRAGAAITYDLGRKLNSDFNLTEQRIVGPTAEAKIFGEWLFFPVIVRLDLRQALGGGYQGFVSDIGAYLPIAGSREKRYFVFAGPAVTYGSRQYMAHYFGVSVDQSRQTGLPEFNAGGGFKQASIGINATWFFHGSWFINGAGAIDHFLGAAARTPFAQQNTQGTINLTVGYLFGAYGM